MTEPTQDPDDAAWLEALAGRGGAASDSVSGRQAALLRRALEQRRARLDLEVPEADESLFQRIADKVRAGEQGEDLASTGNRSPGLQATDTDYRQLGTSFSYSELRSPSVEQTPFDLVTGKPGRENEARPVWRRPTVWGLAASLVLGVALVYQVILHPDGGDEQLRMRNGDDRVVVRTADPAKRASDIAAALRAKGIQVQVDSSDPRQQTLTLPSSPETLTYLRGQRIEPGPVLEGKAIVLVLVPKPR